jgi:diaminopimelate epimerase
MVLHFTKMHGLGNDFVVIDGVTKNVTLSTAIIKRLSDRHLGIGCDQVLLVEPPKQSNVDFEYRIFNSDGSEVEQCGNGARCLARFIRDRQLSGKSSLRVTTQNRTLTLNIIDESNVTVDMGIPSLEPSDLPFETAHRDRRYTVDLYGEPVSFSAVSMGNPHVILFVNEVQSAPVNTLGPQLENHSQFPNKVNVGFAEILNRHTLVLRVHERGAGETRACGSGACAAVVAAIDQGLAESPVQVQLTGGNLIIQWPGEGHPLIMQGSATTSFHGRIKL